VWLESCVEGRGERMVGERRMRMRARERRVGGARRGGGGCEEVLIVLYSTRDRVS